MTLGVTSLTGRLSWLRAIGGAEGLMWGRGGPADDANVKVGEGCKEWTRGGSKAGDAMFRSSARVGS